MMQPIEGLSDRVVAMKAEGRITSRDYEQVLIPAVEAALSRFSRIRLLYAIDRFEGFDPLALWDDAKIGLSHWSDFEKVAVVTDQRSLAGAVKFMAFAMPCPVRVFASSALDEAKRWIEDESEASSLRHSFESDGRILVIEPHGRLSREDFERLSEELDPILAERGEIAGILIRAQRFPGWQNLGGLLSHLRFVREHRSKVRRIALVTDDMLLQTVPVLIGTLLGVEVRHFPASEAAHARSWLGE